LKVLLTFAVEPEFAPLRKLREFEEFRIGDVSIYQARIGRATVDVVVTGMGPANAQRAAEAAMSVPHTICICSGFCGALKSEHHVGDILAARAVQQMGKNKTIECSQGLVTNAWGDGAKHAQHFLSSEKIVATAEEKARLAPFADAVDMESFAILSVAHERKLSAVAIRVVSDRFDQDVPVDFSATVDEKGRVRIAGVLQKVVFHPINIPALIRLGRESKTAAEGLANFLEAYIKKISLSTHGWPQGNLSDVASRRAARAK
jgi:adenosylhomocysteine nucleosidase